MSPSPAWDQPKTLVGTTEEELRRIRHHLPAGTEIATYPLDERRAAAALTSADLDGDGKVETVVIFQEQIPPAGEGTAALTLALLTGERQEARWRAIASVTGGVLFHRMLEGVSGPLTILDVTGDGRPEVLVVSGSGASAGGILQAFSYDGTTLSKLGLIGGHSFEISRESRGKPARIIARYKDGEASTYEWDGRQFEKVN